MLRDSTATSVRLVVDIVRSTPLIGMRNLEGAFVLNCELSAFDHLLFLDRTECFTKSVRWVYQNKGCHA